MATWLYGRYEDDNYNIIDELTEENPSPKKLYSVAQKIMDEDDIDCVYIGKGERITADYIVPDDLGDDILEHIEDYAAGNIGNDDDLITATAAERKLLNDRLYEVIVNWIEERNVLAEYYNIPKTLRFVREGLI